ncbi:MAG: c-type cytochrome [Acidobacteria bacterium]|nr:c-type cytochrome [Acidobacteriota bacterium]
MRTGRVLGLATVVTLVAAAFWGYRLLSTRSFSAWEKPTSLEAMLARHARRLATSRGVRDLQNPLPPTPLSIAEARDHFADHCAVCHANDSSGKMPINEGLYPPAPDLRESSTQVLCDGELFYIIMNGIRFTGMPGWDGEDEENWKLVLFIRHLPQLTPKELELMKEINHYE